MNNKDVLRICHAVSMYTDVPDDIVFVIKTYLLPVTLYDIKALIDYIMQHSKEWNSVIKYGRHFFIVPHGLTMRFNYSDIEYRYLSSGVRVYTYIGEKFIHHYYEGFGLHPALYHGHSSPVKITIQCVWRDV